VFKIQKYLRYHWCTELIDHHEPSNSCGTGRGVAREYYGCPSCDVQVVDSAIKIAVQLRAPPAPQGDRIPTFQRSNFLSFSRV
jgi:hypothetical protein